MIGIHCMSGFAQNDSMTSNVLESPNNFITVSAYKCPLQKFHVNMLHVITPSKNVEHKALKQQYILVVMHIIDLLY